MTIVVFLENDATEEDVESVKGKIEKINNVDNYKFQSKVDVKKQMQAELLFTRCRFLRCIQSFVYCFET